MRGSIVSIHIASEEGGELQPLDRAELVAGCVVEAALRAGQFEFAATLDTETHFLDVIELALRALHGRPSALGQSGPVRTKEHNSD